MDASVQELKAQLVETQSKLAEARKEKATNTLTKQMDRAAKATDG